MPDHDRGPTPEAAAPGRRLGPSPWPWMALACLALGASGALRVSQEQRFADAARSVEVPPFAMRALPERIGPWQMLEEQVLSEDTLQVAGCSDYMARTYVDDRTGVALSVLVAFGPAERVFGHAPTVCFPAFGYAKAAGPRRQVVRCSAPEGGDRAREVPFDALVYTKPDGGTDALIEVYYSFRHADRWAPDAAATRKQFRHRPAMFKVQAERPVNPGEAEAGDGPIEEFLADLVPAIERRLAEAEGPGAS